MRYAAKGGANRRTFTALALWLLVLSFAWMANASLYTANDRLEERNRGLRVTLAAKVDTVWVAEHLIQWCHKPKGETYE